MASPNLAVIDPMLLAIVGATAARLAGTYGFNRADRDDIRQDILLDCIVRLQKFDPAKSGRRTYLHRIVRHRVATLLDGQRAACRDYRLCRQSLDGPSRTTATESVPLGEILSRDDYESGIGRDALSSHERSELRIDVGRVVSLLPADLASVAVLLRSVSAVEAGRRLGVSRSTLHRRIADIRGFFQRSGLNLYLNRVRHR
jgi:RNA polymerase sigma-70 factor (ECF subfamily)